MDHWSDTMTRVVGSTASVVLHTIFFAICFMLPFFGIPLDRVLLVLTTVVSLEAIYLALFIQMSVNRTAQTIEEIDEDIEEIHEEIDEIDEDLEDLAEDIEEDDEKDKARDKKADESLAAIQRDIAKILVDIERLKNKE